MISKIYRFHQTGLPDSIKIELGSTLDAGINKKDKPIFFFRADDIGVPSRNFSRMMELFVAYNVPLSLAVVPTWLTQVRWESMKKYHADYQDLFCWYLHGWRHVNHEPEGKKQEFGSSRSLDALRDELIKGRDRLKLIMKEYYSPFFTPPWNRCSKETMSLLIELGFKGLSRDHGARPKTPYGLMEISVHVDLHTRKENNFQTGWSNLFNEFQHGMASGVCGIMLHHMRMNENAFVFLEHLLGQMANRVDIKVVTFDELADNL